MVSKRKTGREQEREKQRERPSGEGEEGSPHICPDLLASFGCLLRPLGQEVEDLTPGPKLTGVFFPLPQMCPGKEMLALRVLPFCPQERWGAAV